MKEAIVLATIALLGEGGLSACTVDRIAARTPCAKGLVNYHFGSKETLLRVVSRRVETERWSRRIEAIESGAPGGTAMIDALWEVLVGDVRSGATAARLALIPSADASPPSGEPASRLAGGVSRTLGLDPDSVDPVLFPAALDGLEVSLLAGEREDRVREAFDRLWLLLLPT